MMIVLQSRKTVISKILKDKAGDSRAQDGLNTNQYCSIDKHD